MTTPERERTLWKWLAAPAALMVAAWSLFLVDRAPGTSAALNGFPLDDAWIHQVYARALAVEGGFHYNAGVPEGGMTSPLWVVMLAPLHLAGHGHTLGIVIGTKVLGLLCGLAGLVLIFLLASELDVGGLGALCASVLFAVDPSLSFARASGMEVPLFVALSLGAILVALRGRIVATGLLAGLAVVARPEGAAFLPLYALAALYTRRATGPRAGELAAGVVLALLPAAAYAAFCRYATGHPLPNSYYVKFGADGPLSPALLSFVFKNYVHDNLPYFALEAGALAGLLGCARILRRAGVRGALVLGAGLFMFLVAIESRRFAPGHYFYWERWIMPWSPFFLLAIGAGLGEIAAGFPSLRFRRRGLVYGVLAGLVALLIVAPVPRALRDRADAFAWNAQNIEEMNVAVGRWLDANAPQDAVVAVNDAGAIRYFGARTTIDLLGLNTHAMIDRSPEQRTTSLLETRTDYVAVVPALFAGFIQRLPLKEVYTVRSPHYTLCDGPQDVMTLYRFEP